MQRYAQYNDFWGWLWWSLATICIYSRNTVSSLSPDKGGRRGKNKKQIVRALYTISITRILFSTENGERTDRNSTRWAINVHRQTHQTPLSYFIYKYLVRAFLLSFLSKSVSPLSLTLAFTEREICRDAER